MDFKPDWVWIKKRNEASSHFVVDSSRGLANEDDGNGNARQLATNATYAEDDTSNNTGDNGLGSLIVMVLLVGSLLQMIRLYKEIIQNNDTFVACNWLANGGTTSSNSDGSITSTVQANTTMQALALLLYTGDNGSSATLGHGLQVNGASLNPWQRL